ncbi:MAG: hypothetical protein R3F07_05910 [Opitutaceae bacterium]
MSETPPKTRKPWPMTWVVIAIAAFMVIYTLVNVEFRKEEAPHQPYEEAQERQSRFFDFDMNGWKWLTVETTDSWDLPQGKNPVQVSTRPLEDRLDRELPVELVSAIPKRPRLIPTVARVESYPDEGTGIRVAITPDPDQGDPIQLEGYLKEGRLIILAVVSKKDPSAPPRSPETRLVFRLTQGDAPITAPLSVALYTEEAVHEWTWE